MKFPARIVSMYTHVYLGETGRTLKKWISEHHSAVRRFDTDNGIAVHAQQKEQCIDWDQAKIVGSEEQYCRRVTSVTLDFGLNLSHWQAHLKGSS